MSSINQLIDFKPVHRFFIGVDSDGCAFDAMEIKHKKVFIPLAIKIWGLENNYKVFTEVGEFINLYSDLRGINRFPGLLKTFEYLEERNQFGSLSIKLPDYQDLKEFVESKLPMSNASLKSFADGKQSLFLSQLLEWSISGDTLFKELVEGLSPFQYVEQSLEKAQNAADTMVVSAASTEGLYNDWRAAGILKYMTLVAGQEIGGKQEQLRLAVQGKYDPNCVLMIGDAPGDMKAAKSNNALFYPIYPGKEIQSWERFYFEAFNRFILGQYKGAYEDELIEGFLKILPNKKPW